MSKPYRLVVFDWEGTLGDTLGPVLNLIKDEANRLGFGQLDEQKAREYVVLGLPHALRKLFPHVSLDKQEQLLQSVQHALAINSLDVCLIPGALDVIKRMKHAGMELGIATNKGHASLMRALQASGLDAYFKVVRCAGQVPTKPCPQMLEEIMDEFGIPANKTLMIGDSQLDIEMAGFAHVDAIGVDFDHVSAHDLRMKGAIEVFDDYHKLADYLKLPMIEG